MPSSASPQYSREYLRQERDLPKEVQVLVRIMVLEVLLKDGMKLASGSLVKPLGHGLWEFRIGRNIKSVLKSIDIAISAALINKALLVRVFFSFEEEGILLLGCYNKLKDGGGRAQNLAINKARALLLTIRREK